MACPASRRGVNNVLDEKLYRQLQADKAKLQDEVFSAPPKTMEEFQNRLGHWQQLDETLKLMVEMANEDPDK